MGKEKEAGLCMRLKEGAAASFGEGVCVCTQGGHTDMNGFYSSFGVMPDYVPKGWDTKIDT